MNNKQDAGKWFDSHYKKNLRELKKIVKIPSISAKKKHKKDMFKVCDYLTAYFQELQADTVQTFETKGHPILYAEFNQAGENAKTLLIYSHYDVQPVDPVKEWVDNPFKAVIKGEYMVARGISDMKGQLMACIFAIESILRTGKLPINIKFLIEGEEEIGSPNLDPFIESHMNLFACDMILNPDAGMVAKDMPTLVYGLRGLMYFELRIDGPKADMHSGLFGGTIANPANVLAQIIARLHNPDGSVAVPGFYDKVLPLTDKERAKIAAQKGADKNFLKASGSPKLFGEAGYTTLERAGARPTLDVNGLYSGFIGQGAKTIIPAYATAKISCRLVPNQDPNEIYLLTQKYISSLIPDTVHASFLKHSSGPAYLAENVLGSENMAKALSDTWGTPVIWQRDGGSVPVATTMKRVLGVDSILTGFCLPDDQIHSPNEHLNLTIWRLGVHALIRFFESFAND